MRDFKCPVCRKRQDLQTTCARCQADLSLVVAARRRIEFLCQRLAEASPGEHQDQHELREELRRLSPAVLATLADN